jgi:hypothetical protein
MVRTCTCPHAYPLCACAEGLRGSALLDRSRWLSALAGWPVRVDRAEAERVMATELRPVGRLRAGWPVWVALPRVLPAVGGGGCGCGGGRA